MGIALLLEPELLLLQKIFRRRGFVAPIIPDSAALPGLRWLQKARSNQHMQKKTFVGTIG